ncbi:MAG: hypothetical protein JJU03_09790 [Idiomarina sp.]|nr:hypothetical protein [Idiomarina sp.]
MHKTRLTSYLQATLLTASLALFSIQANANNDFSITPPDYPREVGGQIFQYFLPAADGFAANVNMQIQPFEGDLDAYANISEQQFEQLGFEVVDVSRGDNELLYEYRGEMQGTMFHWYSRVIRDGIYYYVVTATSLDQRWETERDQLTESVHSFSLNR